MRKSTPQGVLFLSLGYFVKENEVDTFLRKGIPSRSPPKNFSGKSLGGVSFYWYYESLSI